jgi:hypothetical protein
MTPERERAIDLIKFLALLADEPLRSDYLGWAARLEENPDALFHPSELEMLRHRALIELGRLQAAVVQDEPLPGLEPAEIGEPA